jgi:Protein of unknown function, DUF547
MAPQLALAAVVFGAWLPAAAPGTAASFDHSAYDALLRKHVAAGMVDYDAFAAAPEFVVYLKRLGQAEPAALGEQERLAFYINAYNAYTIRLINLKHERSSIRNINKTLGLRLKGPWKEAFADVAGKTLSLDDIEHGIIRRQFKEPRIHFALVCAAMSCPPLRSEAYSGARLDAQLDDQARTFLLDSPDANRLDLQKGILYVSPIFEWYKEDFGTTPTALVAYVARFYPEGPAKTFLLSGKAALATTDYDWTLNSKERGQAGLGGSLPKDSAVSFPYVGRGRVGGR